MRWFKHFTDNHRGRSMDRLFNEMGHAGWGIYVLMEICAEKLEKLPDREILESDCVFGFSWRAVENALRMKRKSARQLLGTCQECNLLSWEGNDFEIKISMPILLKLLEYDQRKSRADSAGKPPPARLEKNRVEKNRKEENRIDIICPEAPPAPLYIRQFPDLEYFHKIKELSEDLVNAWIGTYGADWINGEIKKAKIWCLANSKKRPKVSGTFLSNWFSNGWERYRKTLDSSSAHTGLEQWKQEKGIA